MNDVDRVRTWLSSGEMLAPTGDVPTFVDLTRALLRLGGAPDVGGGAGVGQIVDVVGEADHLVFVLIDGLGADMVTAMPDDAFLRAHLVGEVRSVFLSTTACALTTLATGAWPAEHGVPGWWTCLSERGLSITTLPFVERDTRRPLTELGVSLEEVLPVPSAWPQMTHEPLTLLPQEIHNGVYSTYAAGDTLRSPYVDFRQAVSLICRRVQSARAPSFTYLYLPQLDELSHRRGARHAEVGQLLLTLDWLLSDLSRVLAGRARMVVSSDHGIADVTEDKRFILSADDPLAALLRCAPTGEPSVPIFHVTPGQEEAFAATFAERFGEVFALVRPDETESLGLWGPGELSPAMRARLGTFIGVSSSPAIFSFEPCGGAKTHIGIHGGLTPDQMRIPLIVA